MKIALRARRVVTALLLAFTASPIAAQAPFNGRVLQDGEGQLRLDLQSYAAPRTAGGWVWGLPGITAGLGRGLEVSAGLSANLPRPVGWASADVTLGAKWAPLATTTSPVQVALGVLAFVPTERAREAGPIRTATFPYVAATAPLIPSLGDASPVLTVAAYAVHQPRVGPFADRAGAMIGLEQGLPTAVARTLGTDAAQVQVAWVSGKTLFGYASGGITLVKGAVNVSIGYARGNLPAFNHGPTFGVGIAF